MTDLRIEFLDEDDEPAQGHVVFYPAEVALPTDPFGAVKIKTADAAKISRCNIIPTDGHWTTEYNPLNGRIKLLCRKASFEKMKWWKEITGLRYGQNYITNYKVGIIDTGFAEFGEFRPIHVDIEGNFSEIPATDNNYHGHHVYNLIFETGIFEKNNIIVSDVSSFFDKSKLNIEKLISSVWSLVDEHSVDFINISGGIYLDMEDEDDVDTHDSLLAAISYAQQRGCIIFAAVGNNQGVMPAFPAALDSVIGVGSIGKSFHAPRYTVGFSRELQSIGVVDARGAMRNGEKVFHDVTTCHGIGLDVVAPGISIFVHCGVHYIIELFGTSFASPVALSTMAAILNKDGSFGTMPLDSRYQYVKEHLPNWCQDLEIDSGRQGHGLAVFVEG